MAIGPLDMVKTQEVTQLKHMESQKAQHALLQNEKNYQDTIKHDQAKPTKAPKSEDTEYRYDAKEKGNNQYQNSGNRKNSKEKENKKESNDPQKSGGIDILI